MTENIEMNLKEYKTIETRLYGEIMKTCRRYTNDLHLISILGILEIVKEEIRDLDKTSRKLTRRGQIPEGKDDSASLDTIM
jgi:hypothetical protein